MVFRKQKSELSRQAREWSDTEKTISGTPGTIKIPGATPRTNDVLLDALGKGAEMTDEEKKHLVKKIKKMINTLDNKSIREGVDIYSQIGIENIIIYCELDPRDLFEPDRVAGKEITFINKMHPFYTKVLEPLKERGQDDVLASLELLISSLSRSGRTNFIGNEYETIKDFYGETAKDLKRLLNKSAALSSTINDPEEE